MHRPSQQKGSEAEPEPAGPGALLQPRHHHGHDRGGDPHGPGGTAAAAAAQGAPRRREEEAQTCFGRSAPAAAGRAAAPSPGRGGEGQKAEEVPRE